MTMTLNISGVSARGLVREINEDAASVNAIRISGEDPYSATLTGPRHVLLIADGMGGHARGEFASDLALQVIEAQGERLANPQSCVEVLREANRTVFAQAAADPALRGMGATIVGAVISQDRCHWFNVGDSRAYHFRDGVLRQISEDHVPPAIGSGRSHAVTQSLGGTPRFSEVFPAIGMVTLARNDRVLLCSDGLTDVFPDREIADHLNRPQTAGDIVAALLAECLARGGPDNVTIILAET